MVSKTDWGSWAQTIDDVVIEINVPRGTKAKDVRCRIAPKSLSVFVRDAEIIKVSLVQRKAFYNNRYYRVHYSRQFWRKKVYGLLVSQYEKCLESLISKCM